MHIWYIHILKEYFLKIYIKRTHVTRQLYTFIILGRFCSCRNSFSVWVRLNYFRRTVTLSVAASIFSHFDVILDRYSTYCAAMRFKISTSSFHNYHRVSWLLLISQIASKCQDGTNQIFSTDSGFVCLGLNSGSFNVIMKWRQYVV